MATVVLMTSSPKAEIGRLDTFHTLIQIARGGRVDDEGNVLLQVLHEPNSIWWRGGSPLVLDVGCGTGFWAMDMVE